VSAVAETDVAWRGYAGWAMIPGFVVCAVVTLALLGLDWWLDPDDTRFSNWLLGPLLLGVWLVQGLRWLYRTVTYTYRVTNRHLYIDFGSMNLPVPRVAWAAVRGVRVDRGVIERRLGVGSVCVDLTDGRVVEMPGVWQPNEFANFLRTMAKVTKPPVGV